MNSLALLEEEPSTEAKYPPQLVTGEPVPQEPGAPSAWMVLVTALSLSAGHGLVLAVALLDLYRAQNLRELGGPATKIPISWFLLSIPLLVGALSLRHWRPAASTLPWLARATVACTLVAYSLYLFALASA